MLHKWLWHLKAGKKRRTQYHLFWHSRGIEMGTYIHALSLYIKRNIMCHINMYEQEFQHWYAANSLPLPYDILTFSSYFSLSILGRYLQISACVQNKNRVSQQRALVIICTLHTLLRHRGALIICEQLYCSFPICRKSMNFFGVRHLKPLPHELLASHTTSPVLSLAA